MCLKCTSTLTSPLATKKADDSNFYMGITESTDNSNEPNNIWSFF